MYRQTFAAHHLARLVMAVGLILGAGALGYMLIEGWSALDALYMSVITITTVGYREVQPLSTAGQIFTMALALLGLGTLWFTLSVLVGIMVDGQLSRHWERRRTERKVSETSGHQIVCGYGRVGRQIALELQKEGHRVVVVDADLPSLEQAVADGFLVVQGNASEDETLRRAGIERAAGLATAVATDADNIFVTLSARALNPALAIVARANYQDAAAKLRRAGASHVVSPYSMAGKQMARLSIRPSTVQFVDTLFEGTNSDLVLEDVRISTGSPLAGRPLGEVRYSYPETMFLAVLRGNRMQAPPPHDLVLQEHDVLAVVGMETRLRALERACQPADLAAPASP